MIPPTLLQAGPQPAAPDPGVIIGVFGVFTAGSILLIVILLWFFR
jgi:hypothetical protein